MVIPKNRFNNVSNSELRKIVDIMPPLLVLEAGIFAHQMSWPGVHYMSFELSYIGALVGAYFMKPKALFPNDVLSNIFSKYGAVILIVTLLFYSAFAPVKDRRVVAFKDVNYAVSNITEFMNFPVSKADYDAIVEIKRSAKECKAKTLFQLPWAPILYTITGLQNSTSYFLPYADTITQLDGNLIISELRKSPPDLFIMEPFDAHKGMPFKAAGMKLIYNFVESDDFQEGYILDKKIKTDYKEWLIFCRSN